MLTLLGREELILEKETVFFGDTMLRELEVEAINNRNLMLERMAARLNAVNE